MLGFLNCQSAFSQSANLLYWSGQTSSDWNSQNWASDATGSPSTSTPDASTTVVFTATNAQNPDVQLVSNATVAALTFDSVQDIAIVGSGNITVAGPIVVSPNLGNPSVSVPLVVSGSTGRVEILGGSLTVDQLQGTGFEVSNNSQLVFSTPLDSTFSGSISGNGSVVKEGTGKLQFDQDNTIGGDLTVSAGTFQSSQGTTVVDGMATVAGATTPQLLVSGNSTLQANLDLNIGSGSGSSGTVVVQDTATLDASTGLINIGYDQSTGFLIQTGGNITADTVTLGINNGNGTLQLNGGSLETYAVDVATPTSRIAFDGGTLIAKDNMTVGRQDAIDPTPATLASGGATIDTGAFELDWRIPIDGSGALRKTGTGSLVLSANNTYSGGTVIDTGTLQLGNGGISGSLSPTGAISNNGALVFNSTSNLIQSTHFGPSIDGSGSVSQSGSGAVVLNATNAYSGSTILNAGTLQVLHSQALGSGSLELNTGRLVVGSAGANATVVQGIGDFRWNPDATITLESASRIEAGGNFTRLGSTPATHQFEAGSAQILNPGNNLLVSYADGTDFTAADFSMETDPTVSLKGAFVLDQNTKQLLYVLISGIVTGPEISNATPAWADYLINGGTTSAVSPTNTIKSLTFQNSGNLQIASGSTLQVTSGQLDVTAGSSSISGGTLTTPGNLNKTGSGVLDLRNRVVAGGTLNIQAGTVAANGEVYAKNVVVGNTATLAGTGTLYAPVVVSGTLSPGNSVGTITLGGLALNPNSQTIIEVASRSSSDVIVVNGDATLGGTLQIVPTSPNSFSYGDRHTILTTSGGISGQFNAIEVPQKFRGRFLNSGKTGTLLLAPDTYTRVATTPNQRSAASALDSFIPATSGDRLAVSIALDSLTEDQYPAAFEQVSPAIYANLPLILVEQAYNQAQLISQRLGFVRAGVGGGFQFAGVPEPELRYDRNGKSVADPKTLIPLPQEAAVANWNAWVMGIGQFSNSNGWAGVPSGRNNAGGFLVGVDYQWTDDFATGVFGGFQFNQANYDGGGFAKGNGVTFGVYGTYSNDTGWYVDGLVGGGYTAFQTRRTIIFGTIDRTADADPGAGQFNVSLNLGKDWSAGNLRFGPVAGLQYTYATTSSFSEQGADSLDLAISPFGTNSLRSTLGARAAYLWNLSEKFTLVPELRALWMHEFLNGGETLTSSLDGGRGPSFDYQTGSTYADSLFAGAGLGMKIGDQITASLFYNVNFAGESFLNNIISADLNVAF